MIDKKKKLFPSYKNVKEVINESSREYEPNTRWQLVTLLSSSVNLYNCLKFNTWTLLGHIEANSAENAVMKWMETTFDYTYAEPRYPFVVDTVKIVSQISGQYLLDGRVYHNFDWFPFRSVVKGIVVVRRCLRGRELLAVDLEKHYTLSQAWWRSNVKDHSIDYKSGDKLQLWSITGSLKYPHRLNPPESFPNIIDKEKSQVSGEIVRRPMTAEETRKYKFFFSPILPSDFHFGVTVGPCPDSAFWAWLTSRIGSQEEMECVREIDRTVVKVIDPYNAEWFPFSSLVYKKVFLSAIGETYAVPIAKVITDISKKYKVKQGVIIDPGDIYEEDRH